MKAAVIHDSPRDDIDSMTTSELMERMFDLRDQYRELEAQVKEYKQEYDDLGRILEAKMLEQGVTRAAIPRGTAIYTKTTVFQAHDWSSIDQWAKDNDALHIYQRRLSTEACRELLNAGVAIPGTSPFEKVSVNLRSAK